MCCALGDCLWDKGFTDALEGKYELLSFTTDIIVSSVQDTEILIPKLRNVQKVIKLPWNHVDMVLGKNVDTQLYNHILISIKRY